MNKLPIEFKEKWLADLRSGEYKQGQYNLYNSKNNSYCCLGVAGSINKCSRKQMDFKSGKLSEIYSQVTPEPLDQDIIDTLTNLNDGFGKVDKRRSFSEIADWIEANL